MTDPLSAGEVTLVRSGGIDLFEELTGSVDADAELVEILECRHERARGGPTI